MDRDGYFSIEKDNAYPCFCQACLMGSKAIAGRLNKAGIVVSYKTIQLPNYHGHLQKPLDNPPNFDEYLQKSRNKVVNRLTFRQK